MVRVTLQSAVRMNKTRERVKQARNRRLFMDEMDFEDGAQESLREVDGGRDAMDIFLEDGLDDNVERQVNI